MLEARLRNDRLYRKMERTEKDGKNKGLDDEGKKRNRKSGHKRRKIRDSSE